MELALAEVAETLAHEFGDLQSRTVVGVLSDCVDEFPYDGSHFIEQAARARLSVLRRPHEMWTPMPPKDSLDVSLHDGDLIEEVELTVRLMVAANETDLPLDREVVDEILGVARRASVIPRQGVRTPQAGGSQDTPPR